MLRHGVKVDRVVLEEIAGRSTVAGTMDASIIRYRGANRGNLGVGDRVLADAARAARIRVVEQADQDVAAGHKPAALLSGGKTSNAREVSSGACSPHQPGFPQR